jgi:hypothetical protein
MNGEQKNTPAAAATATEANGQNPLKESKTKATVAKSKQVRKPLLRYLAFPLSDDEVISKAESAPKKTRAREELDAEFSRVKKDYSGRIAKLDGEIRNDLLCVEEREERREVLAEEVHDFIRGEVRYEYEGRIYERREMTQREKQLTIETAGVL